jgi:hypothetical protein
MLAKELKELDDLRQLLVNAEYVARLRLDYGISDCVDNDGHPYQSQWAHGLICEAMATTKVDGRLATWKRASK